ncbi:carbohydrate-binding module family 50 protein [Daldinia caldariorum]|uniref:carbohydrate-binding module family 50 protein n=1 Tax=Daldinia caldariorum TaxID=326644 RepID=UPI002007DC89|nr:carbohydrate-binding module family 50 protein [Daldinia caldariorum]KAI1466532.1 carbohydrate-binding module family 50 protein [Daldinia caldariorum]
MKLYRSLCFALFSAAYAWPRDIKDHNVGCNDVNVGHSYCAEVDHGQPVSTPTIMPVGTMLARLPSTTPEALLSNRTFATITTSAAASHPTLMQIGIASDCSAYHQARAGDTCSKIAAKYKLSDAADFVKWNPAVEADCSGLRTHYFYCVAIKDGSSALDPIDPIDDPKTVSRGVTTGIPPGCIRVHPTPTQPGSVCRCKLWHEVAMEDTCVSIEAHYQISADDFNKWNPLVGPMCKLLWMGYNVCVGV